MNDPTIYGMLRHEFAGLIHRHHPSLPSTQEAPTMTSALIDAIENDIKAGQHAVRDVLEHHLTTVNLAGELAQRANAAEGSPVVQALETAALGPAGEAMVAGWIHDAAALIGHVDAALQPATVVPAAGDPDAAARRPSRSCC